MLRSKRLIFLCMKLVGAFAICSATMTALASSISVNYYDAIGRVKAVYDATDVTGESVAIPV